MVNLILDTNAWIYLANGFNPDTKKNEEDLHFQLVTWILEKMKTGHCTMYSNYIVRLEWNRNREKCNALILKYNNNIAQKRNELRNNRKSPNFLILSEEFNEIEKTLTEKIKRNQAHILTIERILEEAVEIPIEDSHKLKAVDLAVEKKPPFHHKDNSVADAIIFLSTIDYFYYNEELSINDTFFVSNNTSDFGESINNKTLHPELAKMLKDKPIVFETNLAKALDLGEKVIRQYESYLDYINRDFIMCMANCNGAEYYMAEVEFNEHIEIEVDSEGYKYNPNQLLLDFGEDFNFTVDELKAREKVGSITIDVGVCRFCDTLHLRCECGEEHAALTDFLECGCGREYSIMEDTVLLIENFEDEEI